MSWITKVKRNRKSFWEFRWYENAKIRSRRIPGAKTKGDAKNVQSAWDVERSKLEESPAKPEWTLAEAYEKVKDSRDYSPNYLNNLETFWGRTEKKTDKKGTFGKAAAKVGILEHFGKDALLSEIKVADVLDWISFLKRHLTPKKTKRGTEKDTRAKGSTVNHYRNALSRAFTLAMAYGFVDSNPCRHPEVDVQLPDDTATRDRVATPEEIKKILSQSSKNTRTFLVIAWATGARMSEILTLEWKDLLYDRKEIQFEHDPVRGKWVKGKKTASVAVHPEILQYLKDHHEPVDDSNWVFAHGGEKRRGERIKSLKKGIRDAVERAELEGISSHIVRHSVGSFLGANGAPLSTIRDHLRHGDFRMTNRYTHGIDEEKLKASQVLLEALKGSNACLNACAGSKIEKILLRLKNDPEVVSAVKTIRRKMERETGFEPATLSLEG